MTHLYSTIKWHYVEHEMPDAELTVLVATDPEGDAFEGFWAGDHWCNAGGMALDETVYAWADVPRTPEPLQAALKI